jgi:hypothetical protein
VSEPQLLIVGGRRRGRPPSTEPKTHLTVYLPTAYIDRLSQLALKHDVSVSKAFCQAMDLATRMPRTRIPEQNK